MEDFRKAIKERLLLCDGAMGTMLYQKGEYTNHSYDELSITKPELVREIHREYVAAGADIIETNSYGANRINLTRYKLEDKVREINIAAAQNATYEARGAVWVAGSIGTISEPDSPMMDDKADELRLAYSEQIEALIEGGVNLFALETFWNMPELELALEEIRKLSDLPVIANMTFNEEGKTPAGEDAGEVARRLNKLSVDVIGANCSVGPGPMLAVVEKLKSKTDKPISAMPNAGNPQHLDGRFIYMTTPEYLTTYAKRYIRAGAGMIGGCCGTTPKHIKLLHNAIKALSPSRASIEVGSVKAEAALPIPLPEKSAIAKKLSEGKFVTCVEILPPKGSDPTKAVEKAKKLKAAGVDAVNIPDGPRASARMNPLSLAHIFKTEVGIEPVIHYTCRDRNVLGMQSDLLGANALGLTNILAVTGDPPKLGNYPDATAVYDVDAIGLVKILNNLNHGLDVAANAIGKPTRLHIGVGANPVAINIEEEVRRLYQKVDAGAEFIFTQPIFDHEKFKEFRDGIADITIPIFIGILPISNIKMAKFLHNEIPGMSVPEKTMRRMELAGENSVSEGIKIAGEALKATKSLVQGAYVMSPKGGVKSAIALLEDYL